MRPRLLYLAGVGRSGTTLVGRLVGRHPDAVAVGELTRLPAALTDGSACSCGAPVAACDDFWAPVLATAFPRQTLEEIASTARSVAAIERHRNVPRTLFDGGDARRYAGFVASILDGVHRVTGARTVLDASKRLGPAVALARAERFDLRVVHLVRDPRAVVASWVTRPADGEASTAWGAAVNESLRWEAVDRGLSALRVLGVGVERIRFEDLIDRPDRTLELLCRHGGLGAEGLAGVVEHHRAHLGPDHVIGNDPVGSGVDDIELRRDDSWRYELGHVQARVVSALTRSGRQRHGLADLEHLGPLRPQPAADADGDRPGVSVVVATHGRPELVRRTIDAIIGQRYNGAIEVVVVHDNEPLDDGLPREVTVDGRRRVVRSIDNGRSPGLAGARNSGIAVSGFDLVAFCDDDDVWFPNKLARQVDRLVETGLRAVVCGIEIEFDGIFTSRVPAMDVIELGHLLRSRIVEAHPSGYLFRRSLLTEVGPVDETLAGSYAEDYELLLRIARNEPIATVREPLVRVLWGRTSFFAEGWRNRIEALSAVLEEFPEFTTDPAGLARIQGQISFAYASMDEREQARRWARVALASDPTQPRVLLAGAVASGAVASSTVIRALQSTGRGV